MIFAPRETVFEVPGVCNYRKPDRRAGARDAAVWLRSPCALCRLLHFEKMFLLL